MKETLEKHLKSNQQLMLSKHSYHGEVECKYKVAQKKNVLMSNQ